MQNRIDDLIKKAIENPKEYERELLALQAKAEANPHEKQALYFEFNESLAATGNEIRALSVKAQLEEVADLINISYIAKKYFKKSRQWLNHRINGNVVNGQPVHFTDEQARVFNNALMDISQKIGSIRVKPTRRSH